MISITGFIIQTFSFLHRPQNPTPHNISILWKKVLCSLLLYYSSSDAFRWKKVEDKLFGADDIPVAVLQAGKLRDKDRQIIKDKFAVSLWCKRVQM
jgi:hypothetical protein